MSLMQRRRNAADGRSADQMLDDLMEDLNRPSESLVVEGSERAQPEGGAQEVVLAGAGGPQPGHNGGAEGVMEGLSPDQQAVLRQAAEVLRSGAQLQCGRLLRRQLWWMQEGDLNIFQGANNKVKRAGGTDPGKGQRGDEIAQGVAGGGLLGSSCTSCWWLGTVGAST